MNDERNQVQEDLNNAFNDTNNAATSPEKPKGPGDTPNLDRDERDLDTEDLAEDRSGKDFPERDKEAPKPPQGSGTAQENEEKIESLADMDRDNREAYPSGDNDRNRGSSATGSTDNGGAMDPRE